MAAPQRYPSVHAQLLGLAVRARAEGIPFDVFWAAAIRPGRPVVTWRTPRERVPVGAVIWPSDTFDRQAARDAHLDAGTREAWRRAYEEAPQTRQDRALRLLAPVLDGGPLVAA